MWMFVVAGALLLLLCFGTMSSVVGMIGQETTIMQQQFTLMNLLLAVLSFIGALALFGVAEVLRQLGRVHNALERLVGLAALPRPNPLWTPPRTPPEAGTK